MAKKEISLHDFLIAKLRSASQKWPETYKIKQRVRIEVQVKYDKADPDFVTIMVPKTECTLANGDKFTVQEQVIRKGVYKPARNETRLMYMCEQCKRLFFEKEYILDKKGKLLHKVMIAADHIFPIVDPNTGFIDWNTYIDRMFPGPSGLQILCNYPNEMDGELSCHRVKTTIEKGIAAERVRKEKGLPPKKKRSLFKRKV